MDSYSSCDGYLTSHRFANSGEDVDLTDHRGQTFLYEMGIVTSRTRYYSDLAQVSRRRIRTSGSLNLDSSRGLGFNTIL